MCALQWESGETLKSWTDRSTDPSVQNKKLLRFQNKISRNAFELESEEIEFEKEQSGQSSPIFCARTKADMLAAERMHRICRQLEDKQVVKMVIAAPGISVDFLLKVYCLHCEVAQSRW